VKRVEERSNLPNFLVVGAMKAGTTSLHSYLRTHPQIFMPSAKELHFFVQERNWTRGLQWYERQFGPASMSFIARGEASTSYTMYPRYAGVPARIAACLGDASFVYVLRDPIERIKSHYRHNVTTGVVSAPIETAVEEDPTYVDCSRYALQIEQYLEHFPRERLLVITAEELRWKRWETVRLVFDFLGVDPDWIPPDLETEYYRSDDRRIQSSITSTARRNIKKVLPGVRLAPLDRARERVSHLLRGAPGMREAGRQDEMDRTIRMHLDELLVDDLKRLEEYVPDAARRMTKPTHV
jgi:hypothetical protein